MSVRRAGMGPGVPYGAFSPPPGCPGPGSWCGPGSLDLTVACAERVPPRGQGMQGTLGKGSKAPEALVVQHLLTFLTQTPSCFQEVMRC